MNILDYALDIQLASNEDTKGFAWELTNLIEREADKSELVELCIELLKELSNFNNEDVYCESDLEDALQEGYDYGREEGYDSGHYDGYGEGYSVGHEAGYSEGHYQGYEEGYSNGYAEGLHDKL